MGSREKGVGYDAGEGSGYRHADFKNALWLSIATTDQEHLVSKDVVSGIQQYLRTPDTTGMKKFVKQVLVPAEPVDVQPALIGRQPQVIQTAAGDFREGLIDSLVTASVIDRIKRETLGEEASTAESNYLIALMLERSAWQLVADNMGQLQRNNGIFTAIRHLELEFFKETELQHAWFAPKIGIFLSSAMQAFDTLTHIESLEETKESDYNDARDLMAANKKLIVQTGIFNNYTVKSVIAPSLSGGFVREWQIDDGNKFSSAIEEHEDESNGPHKYVSQDDPLAIFVGTDDRFVSDKFSVTKTGSAHDRVDMIKVSPQTENGGSFVFVKLTRDGKILSYHGFDIREYTQRSGMGLYAYQKLRADILALYADSVASAEVAEKANKITRANTTTTDTKVSEKEPSMRDFVLARVKVIAEDKDAILDTLDKELTENISDDHEETGGEKKEREQWEVSGHRVRIPAHHRASKEARENALREKGIVLADFGETYQKKHIKGTLPPTTLGYRARRKSPSEPRRIVEESASTGSSSTVNRTGDLNAGEPINLPSANDSEL